MAQSNTEKLDQIITDLEQIKKTLKIVPDRETVITDFDPSIQNYQGYAKDELKLADITIDNQRSAILGYLQHSKGIINKNTVREYLDSNESAAWKTNQVKALRRYLRDFLKLGNWIKEFKFSKTRAKPKVIPSDEQIAEFCSLLPYQVQMVFLVMHNSGLRIGEVLSLKLSDIDFDTNMIDASNVHKGETKSSWISFFTEQTSDFLDNYTLSSEFDFGDDDPKLFSVSARSVQQAFKKASGELNVSINPHLLRTVFAEKCEKAGMDDKYVNAFCGRISQGMIAKHYTDYSPTKLREQYDKVEPYLTLVTKSQ